MSDFLGRLMARHAEGSASAIRPRAVSRFEAPTPPVEPETVEQEIPLQRAASPSALATPAIAPAVRNASRVDEPSGERIVRDEPPTAAPVRSAPSTVARIEQMLKQVETIIRSPSPGNGPAQEASKPPIVTTTPVVPKVVPSVESRPAIQIRSGLGQHDATESEPHVIRVHIGRIDVRANIPAVERPRLRSTSSEKAKPMSLDRYLSGKDRA